VRKRSRHKAIVTLVDELEATLADCARRIMDTNGVLTGEAGESQWLSQQLDDVRSQLDSVVSKNTVLRGEYLPGNRGIPPAIRWLGSNCSRFIEVQASALGGIVDVLTVTSRAEGNDLERLRKYHQCFEGAYEEYRKLTALALSDEGETDAALDARQLADVNDGITDFHQRFKEFTEFWEPLAMEQTGGSDALDHRSDRITH